MFGFYSLGKLTPTRPGDYCIIPTWAILYPKITKNKQIPNPT